MIGSWVRLSSGACPLHFAEGRGCGHRLWSEIRNAGAFRFLAHFDDEGSATYAEHSPSCPSCDLKLDEGRTGPEAPGEHPRRGG